MRGDRRIVRSQNAHYPTASSLSRKTPSAVSPPLLRTPPNAFARENLPSPGCRRLYDLPTPKVAGSSVHEIPPATRDRTEGPSQGAKTMLGSRVVQPPLSRNEICSEQI